MESGLSRVRLVAVDFAVTRRSPCAHAPATSVSTERDKARKSLTVIATLVTLNVAVLLRRKIAVSNKGAEYYRQHRKTKRNKTVTSRLAPSLWRRYGFFEVQNQNQNI